jgi:hypothetical protein
MYMQYLELNNVILFWTFVPHQYETEIEHDPKDEWISNDT